MISTSTKVRLCDPRDGKVYAGVVISALKIGYQFRINLSDAHDFVITEVKRILRDGNNYWVVDTRNVKFKVTIL